MQLVLDTKGIQVIKKNETFHITGEKGSRSFSPGKLTSIAITANVLISTGAISLAIKHKIPILIFDRFGRVKGRLWSPRFESIATLRRQQVKFAETTEATIWLIDIFDLKSTGQIRNLQYLQMRAMPYPDNMLFKKEVADLRKIFLMLASIIYMECFIRLLKAASFTADSIHILGFYMQMNTISRLCLLI